MSNTVYKFVCNDCGKSFNLYPGFIEEYETRKFLDFVEIYYCPICHNFEHIHMKELRYYCPKCNNYLMVTAESDDIYYCFFCKNEFDIKDIENKRDYCKKCKTKMVNINIDQINEDDWDNFKSVRYVRKEGAVKKEPEDCILACSNCGSKNYKIIYSGTWNECTGVSVHN